MSPVRAIRGDSREVLRTLDANSIDSCVTDPPYALVSIATRFGKDGAAPAKSNGATGVYGRASAGFMGQKWDTGETAFDPAFWAEVLRVLKPGAHLLAFGGTRTYHRLAVAIEDAGFEIRDAVMWHYGQGFPKSHNISEGLKYASCTCEGAARPTATLQCGLRPVRRADVSTAEHACEEQGEVLLAGVQDQGASQAVLRGEPGEGSQGREERRMEGRGNVQAAKGQLHGRSVCARPGMGDANGADERLHHGASLGDGADVRVSADAHRSREPHRSQPIEQPPAQFGALADECGSQAWRGWPLCERCRKPMVPEGLGTALKPSTEIIVLARKPLSEPTIAANVLKWGTGAINVDGCRVGTEERVNAPAGNKPGGNSYNLSLVGMPQDAEARAVTGRWPANLIHDGSDEVLAGFPESQSTPFRANNPGTSLHDGGITFRTAGGFAETGSAARFFYTAKADAQDRLGSKHPTVKPVDLMAYLVRLITPRGGTVLDPFAGTGTTGEAALREGCKAILIEREPQYFADIERRMALAMSGPEERQRAIIKASGKLDADPGPLFREIAE